MIDENIRESLNRYIKHRIHAGGFLTAVLENNLMEAMGRADSVNRANLHEICKYIYNNLPRESWGSREKVQNYLNR